MKYYKVVLACGHTGVGHNIDVARYLEATNLMEALNVATSMPRVKKKGTTRGLYSINEITYEEYLAGKKEEVENFYLQNTRKRKYA